MEACENGFRRVASGPAEVVSALAFRKGVRSSLQISYGEGKRFRLRAARNRRDFFGTHCVVDDRHPAKNPAQLEIAIATDKLRFTFHNGSGFLIRKFAAVDLIQDVISAVD